MSSSELTTDKRQQTSTNRGPSHGTAARPGRHAHKRVSPQQWRSGIAAWLGWLFDGLDMHLYTLVATPFVAQLLDVGDQRQAAVGYYGSLIQAAFLVGWALGGGLFGRIGDRLGRARALMLTILTYALFTGLSFFAQTWWHLLICRFLAALGIGGEWAVGAALLSETWPRRWRPWIAAVLPVGRQLRRAAGHGRRVRCSRSSPTPTRTTSTAACSWWACCRRCWCCGFAAPCPSRRSGTRPRPSAGTAVAAACCDLFRGTIRRTTLLTIAGLRGSPCRPTGPSCTGSCSTSATCPTWPPGASRTRPASRAWP